MLALTNSHRAGNEWMHRKHCQRAQLCQESSASPSTDDSDLVGRTKRARSRCDVNDYFVRDFEGHATALTDPDRQAKRWAVLLERATHIAKWPACWPTFVKWSLASTWGLPSWTAVELARASTTRPLYWWIQTGRLGTAELLFVCLLACVFSCLLSWLLVCLLACLLACWLGCLFACLFGCLLTCWLAALFVCLFVLFCFVLFCCVVFCFVLFCFVLFCFVLFCVVLCCVVLCCVVLFCFVLFCFV